MFTQYTLYDSNGKPVQIYHQDDDCNPLTSDSIAGLLYKAAIWADICGDFIEELHNPNSEYGKHTIIREEVMVLPLIDEDKTEIEKIKEKSRTKRTIRKEMGY